MQSLPKIDKKLENVPKRPVITNCGTPTENTSEFLDYHLPSFMQIAKLFVTDTSDFLRKIKEPAKAPDSAISNS